MEGGKAQAALCILLCFKPTKMFIYIRLFSLMNPPYLPWMTKFKQQEGELDKCFDRTAQKNSRLSFQLKLWCGVLFS